MTALSRGSWGGFAVRAAACFTVIWVPLSAIGFIVSRPREVPWHFILGASEFWRIVLLPPVTVALVAGAVACLRHARAIVGHVWVRLRKTGAVPIAGPTLAGGRKGYRRAGS